MNRTLGPARISSSESLSADAGRHILALKKGIVKVTPKDGDRRAPMALANRHEEEDRQEVRVFAHLMQLRPAIQGACDPPVRKSLRNRQGQLTKAALLSFK
jgi:hypothetical protein